MRGETARPHVLGIGGTLRPNSSSSRALALALESAEAMGATVELIELDECALPFYRPEVPLESLGPGAARLIAAARRADALIWSTSAYHGVLSGAIKNALDFFEFLAGDEVPYLTGKPVGLISTAAGEMAAVNAVNSMIPVAHALRAVVVPLCVPISHAPTVFAAPGGIDPQWRARLEKLGRLTVEMAAAGAAREREPEGRASLLAI